MLNQFRSLYPQGSLISELLTIDHGKYIVRVLVMINGITLATGLAAAETVEKAEDQARNRALTLLNLNPESVNNSQNQTTKSVSKTTTNSGRNKKQEPTNLATTNLITPISSSLPALENTFSDTSNLTSPMMELESTVEANSPQVPETTNPIPLFSGDLSEAIAKTQVELKRLGWTNEQGRDYLLQTYGKRSRQLLSDQELLEFLQHLENQP